MTEIIHIPRKNLKSHITDFSFQPGGNTHMKALQVNSLVKKLTKEDAGDTCRELIKTIKHKRRNQCSFTKTTDHFMDDYVIENRKKVPNYKT